MMNEPLFLILLRIWSLCAAGVFILLFFIPAPYGKVRQTGWGAALNSRLAWIVMETVSLAGMIVLFVTGSKRTAPYAIFFLLWITHYTYRALIFPLLKRTSTAGMPILIVCFAVCFNAGNSFFNGYALFHLGPAFTPGWLTDVRFMAGTVFFLAGLIINIHSDRILRRLREKGDRSYKIPTGGLFRFVSCPNYFGEILEWSGWALATWSLAGFSFMLWTIANLAPRAFTYHAWYKRTFANYPAERKALIPWLW